MQDYREVLGMCGVGSRRDHGLRIWTFFNFVSSIIAADSGEIELAM